MENVRADKNALGSVILCPNEFPLGRQSVIEAGLIDLDGYMGKVGALSLATGKFKYSTDSDEKVMDLIG